MRFLELLAPGPHIGWLVLVVIAQSTVLIMAATLIAITLLKRRPALRHSLWLCCLGCVLLSPVIVAILDRAGVALAIVPWTQEASRSTANVKSPTAEQGLSPREDSSRRLAKFSAASLSERDDVGDGITGKARSSNQLTSARLTDEEHQKERDSKRLRMTPSVPATDIGFFDSRALTGALVLTWAIGVVIALGRLSYAWRRLVRLREAFEPIGATDLGDAYGEVRDALGLANLPPINASPGVTGPAAVGVLRPCVVLPRNFAKVLSGEQIRDVLIHECAHVMRRDPLIGLLQGIAGALYWPHPLVHHLNVWLGRAREEVCDNYAIEAGDACEYSRTLLRLTEACRPSRRIEAGLGFTDANWTLRDRITGLLDPERDTTKKTTLRRSLAMGLGLTVICLVLGVVRPVRPQAVTAERADHAPSSKADERIARGIVVDESGQPVAGAIVTTARREKTIEPATTSAHGSFRLRIGGFMLAKEELVAWADGGRLMGIGKHVEARHSDLTTAVRIVLKPSRVIKVNVRDATDRAVEAATVAVVGYDFTCESTTGADGEAVLRFPADAEVRWIVGLKPGVGSDYFENYLSKPAHKLGPLPPSVKLRLDGARTVRIKAVDTAGQPVSDVEFRPWYIQKADKLDSANLSGAEFARSRTDATGVAAFDWLPAKLGMGVPFLIKAGRYSCPNSPVYRLDGNATMLEARLLRNTTIKGVVRQVDGRPAGGLLIRAEGRGATSHYCRMHTKTRDDGSYSLDVYPEQSYMIAVLDEKLAARSLSGVIVHEGKPLEGLDLTVSAGTLIHGRVLNSGTGEPVKGEFINLSEHGQELPPAVRPRIGEGTESLPQWAYTDESGRYQVRVGPGVYSIATAAGDESAALTVVAETDITHDFQVNASSEWKELAGIVIEQTEAGPAPIPGALIEAVRIGRHGVPSHAVADAFGKFQISVPPRTALLMYARGPKKPIAGFQTIGADDSEARIEVSTGSSISGRVLDAGGSPLSGQRVQITISSPQNFPSSGRFYSVVPTDKAGRFEFQGIIVGATVEVSVIIEDADGVARSGKVQRIEIQSADPISVPDIMMPEANANAAR
jgi:beta-lactamase regulating signal transducer with metallopeptidase domain